MIKDVEVKEPQAGEVLMKVHACGVCHSDSLIIEGGMGPMYIISSPFHVDSVNNAVAHTTTSFSATKPSEPLSLLDPERKNGKRVIELVVHGMVDMMARARVVTRDFSKCVTMGPSTVLPEMVVVSFSLGKLLKVNADSQRRRVHQTTKRGRCPYPTRR